MNKVRQMIEKNGDASALDVWNILTALGDKDMHRELVEAGYHLANAEDIDPEKITKEELLDIADAQQANLIVVNVGKNFSKGIASKYFFNAENVENRNTFVFVIRDSFTRTIYEQTWDKSRIAIGTAPDDLAYFLGVSMGAIDPEPEQAEPVNNTEQWPTSGAADAQEQPAAATGKGKSAQQTTYKMPDYKRVHKAMLKGGTTVLQQWMDYCERCKAENETPYQLTQFRKYYRIYAMEHSGSKKPPVEKEEVAEKKFVPAKQASAVKEQPAQEGESVKKAEQPTDDEKTRSIPRPTISATHVEQQKPMPAAAQNAYEPPRQNKEPKPYEPEEIEADEKEERSLFSRIVFNNKGRISVGSWIALLAIAIAVVYPLIPDMRRPAPAEEVAIAAAEMPEQDTAAETTQTPESEGPDFLLMHIKTPEVDTVRDDAAEDAVPEEPILEDVSIQTEDISDIAAETMPVVSPADEDLASIIDITEPTAEPTIEPTAEPTSEPSETGAEGAAADEGESDIVKEDTTPYSLSQTKYPYEADAQRAKETADYNEIKAALDAIDLDRIKMRDLDGYSIGIIGHKRGQDAFGFAKEVVAYKFTNTGKTQITFDKKAYVYAEQNGTMLSTDGRYLPNPEKDSAYVKVQPGETIVVYIAYSLINETDDTRIYMRAA